MSDAIRTTIDGAGRILIPKALRAAAGLSARGEVDIRLRSDGTVELRAATRDVRLEDREGIVVAIPVDSSVVLTEGIVNDT